mgnify:FL=1
MVNKYEECSKCTHTEVCKLKESMLDTYRNLASTFRDTEPNADISIHCKKYSNGITVKRMP